MALAVRARSYQLLEVARQGDRAGHPVDYGLVVLVLLNVAAVTLESAGSVSEDLHAYFDAFEVFSVAIFSVEYLGRVWSLYGRACWARASPKP